MVSQKIHGLPTVTGSLLKGLLLEFHLYRINYVEKYLILIISILCLGEEMLKSFAEKPQLK